MKNVAALRNVLKIDNHLSVSCIARAKTGSHQRF